MSGFRMAMLTIRNPNMSGFRIPTVVYCFFEIELKQVVHHGVCVSVKQLTLKIETTNVNFNIGYLPLKIYLSKIFY